MAVPLQALDRKKTRQLNHLSPFVTILLWLDKTRFAQFFPLLKLVWFRKKEKKVPRKRQEFRLAWLFQRKARLKRLPLNSMHQTEVT